MTPSPALFLIDPSFIAEAVFLAIQRYEKRGEGHLAQKWHAERDRIYAIKDSQIREKAFRQLDDQWFSSLGLKGRFEAVLVSFPILQCPSLMIHIRRSPARKEEGSELYVQGDRKTNLVKLQTVRLFEDDYIERFLRHEWLRISDMLDPVFQYSPHAALSGASELEDNLIRDRYRILWDLYISLRLLKRGFRLLIPPDRQKQLIDKAFSKWTAEEREKRFLEILAQRHRTQSDFLRLAKDETLTVPVGRGGILCPLCRFTSFDPPALSADEDSAMINEIRMDYPDWDRSLGICRNCFDLYQSRMSVAP